MSKLYQQLADKIYTSGKDNLIRKFLGYDEFKQILKGLKDKYQIIASDLLGLGTSCITFEIHNTSDVVKICSKKIKYLKEAHTSPHTLKNKSEQMSDVLLPMKEIIYDGKDFFVYIQDKCQPLNNVKSIKPADFNAIVKIIQRLLSQRLLAGQLKPKNVGRVEGRVVLFDYHSMHHLCDRMKTKKNWHKSLVDSLIVYDNLLYASQNMPKRASSQTNKNMAHVMKHKYGNRAMYPEVQKFLDYLINLTPNSINDKKINAMVEQMGELPRGMTSLH